MNIRTDRAKELFLDALEINAPDDRRAFLDRACAGDAALRAEVDGLLAHHPRVGSFLASGPRDPDATAGLDASDCPGTLIGPYKLLEPIGEGGFGVVFMAEQTQPVRRKVALKVLKPGMDTKQVVARFEAERQALALMDHPNIAKVLDAGETASGRPYFVMELVRGIAITDFCDRSRLGVRERLTLFTSVCRAVQHAHQKGVIHRDIKPTNVLVTLHDGMPVPQVIDFGVAKALGQPLTDKTLFTGFAQMVGTPLYMSPEQAELSGLDVDTRSDIYSLGVLLYELLTGTTPFDKERLRATGLDEVRRIIREEEPARPSTRLSTLGQVAVTVSANRGSDPGRLSALIRGELDWVVMKALEKDRNRRYESAGALAADVQRYLADEPVQACPPSAAYRLRKFARRNRGVLTATTLIAVTLVAGTLVSAWQAVLAQKSAADADTRRLEAETARHDAVVNLDEARQAVDQMLTRVSEEQLFNTPQAELLRKALLEEALKFYQRFLRRAGSDPAIRLGAGEAYRRVGQIHRQLGHLDRAEHAYREAVALLEKLVADSPNVPANRLALAQSYHELGDALSRMGRYSESEPELRRAIGLMQGLRADAPEHDGYRRMTAAMDAELAWVSDRLVRVATQRRTEEFYREELRAHEKRLAAADDPQRRHAVASAQTNLARTLMGRRPEEAERLFRDVIAASLKLAGEFPHTAEYRTDLTDARHGLFVLLRAGRRFEEAEQVYRESVPQVEKLIAQAPTLPYPRRLLVEYHWDYALMLEAAGRQQDAEKALGLAIAAAEAMWTEFPTYAWTPARLAMLHNYAGKQYRNGGHFPEAEAAFRKALDVSEKAVRAFPQAELRCRLVDSCFYLGLFLRGRERHKEAEGVMRKLFEPGLISAEGCRYFAWRLATEPNLQLRHPELAVEFARKAVELAPQDGAAWSTLGVALLRVGNRKESINALRRSVDIRKGGDAVDWFFLAMAQWHLDDKDEARRSYARAVEWMDKNKPDDEELRSFRAEATGLLGIEMNKD